MTQFTVSLQNAENHHEVTLETGDNRHSIVIKPKPTGFGSSMNGGEALLLAIATCYCNDIYREAKKQGITVRQVAVEVDADQDGQDGHVMENIVYHVTVESDASPDAVERLVHHTDTVAEIHNTLRRGAAVTLGTVKVNSVGS